MWVPLLALLGWAAAGCSLIHTSALVLLKQWGRLYLTWANTWLLLSLGFGLLSWTATTSAHVQHMKWSLPGWSLPFHQHCCQTTCCCSPPCPPPNAFSPLYFACRANSMDYWHVSFTLHRRGTAMSTESLGMKQPQLRRCVAEPPGTSCLHEGRKGSFQLPICI